MASWHVLLAWWLLAAQPAPVEEPAAPARDAAAPDAPARDIGLTEDVEVQAPVAGRLGAGRPGPASPAVEVVQAGELRRAGARSLPEALAALPSIQSTDQVGNGRQLSLDLRGFSGAEGATALVVDGVRVNDADSNVAAWEMVRLEDVERVEISAGPRGASIGGGSLAGVVHVVRRKPSATPEADVALRAGSFGFRDLSAVATGPVGRWRLLASAGAFTDQGFRDHAGSRERGARLAASRDVGPATLELGWSRLAGRWRQPGALKQSELDHDPSDAAFNRLDATESTTDLATARVEARGKRTSVVAVAGFRNKSADVLATGRSCYGFRTLDSQQSLSLAAEGETELLEHRGARLAVTWGAEAARDRLHPEGYATDETCDGEIHAEALSSATDLDWDRVAAFASLSATTRRGLGLELGMRHDRSRVRREGIELSGAGAWDDVADAHSFGDSSFRFGVGRRHDGRRLDVAWHAAWEQSFLAPSAIQLFAYPGFFSNPSLQPQRGAGPSAGLSLATKDFEGRLELFETRVADEIAYDEGSRRNVNAGSTRRRGADLRLQWTPSAGLRVSAGHSLLDATFRGGFPAGTRVRPGARVPLVPRRRSSSALDLGPWRGFSARVELQRAGRAALSNDFDGSAPELRARTLLGLSLRQELPRARGMRLELSAENLLDDRHPSRGIELADDSYFTPSAPRRVTFGVAWQLR